MCRVFFLICSFWAHARLAIAEDGDKYVQYVDDDHQDPSVEHVSPETWSTMFLKADANSDDSLTLEEMMKFGSDTRKGIFEKEDVSSDITNHDQNKDNMISFAEMIDSMVKEMSYLKGAELEKVKTLEKKRFDAADKNKDGRIDMKEINIMAYPVLDDEAMRTVTQITIDHMDKDKSGDISESEWVRGESEEDKQPDRDSFVSLDKNSNGRLEFDELMHQETGMHDVEKAMVNLWSQADLDMDGQLSKTEWEDIRTAIEDQTNEITPHFKMWSKHLEL